MLYIVLVIQTLIIAGISFLYGVSVNEIATKSMLRKMPPPPVNVMPVHKVGPNPFN